MWSHILRDQLVVDESVFWACVRGDVLPDRGGPRVRPDALPAALVHLLVTKAGADESEITGMAKEEAVARMRRYWTGRG